MSDTIQKICSYCKQPFPATLDFFFKHNQCPDGLQPRCKKCFMEGRKTAKPREEYVDGKKRCRLCNDYFPPTREYFWKYPDSVDKLNYYCITCSKKQDEKNRRAKGMQPQKPAEPGKRQKWYEENKQGIIDRATKWRKDNPEKRKKITDSYDQSDRGKITKRKNIRLRIARKVSNVPYEPFTADDILAMMIAQSYQCFYCKKDISKKYHIDHYMPLAKGGSHALNNIVLACPTCNFQKGSRLPENFIPH